MAALCTAGGVSACRARSVSISAGGGGGGGEHVRGRSGAPTGDSSTSLLARGDFRPCRQGTTNEDHAFGRVQATAPGTPRPDGEHRKKIAPPAQAKFNGPRQGRVTALGWRSASVRLAVAWGGGPGGGQRIVAGAWPPEAFTPEGGLRARSHHHCGQALPVEGPWQPAVVGGCPQGYVLPHRPLTVPAQRRGGGEDGGGLVGPATMPW